MNTLIDQIKNKYNYSIELLNFLEQLIPALITYYGEEYKNKIFNALLNCEIHIQDPNENPEEFLNNYYGTNTKHDMPLLAGAFYKSGISINNNQVTAKPLIYIKTNFSTIYKPFDFTDPLKMHVLVHEILHLIKGYNKIQIKDGKIIESTGLIKYIYSYDEEKGLILEEELNIGIEEALNEADTVEVLEIMTKEKHDVQSYKKAGDTALILLGQKDIAQAIKKSQIEGNDDWQKYLGTDVSQMLIKNFDILVKSLYVKHSDINTKEKRELLKVKMDLAQEEIISFINKYVNNLNSNELPNIAR